jgi:hypothetical protein
LKIAFVSQPEYFRFCYENDLNQLGHVREFPMKFGMGEESYAELINFAPDICICFRGEHIPLKVLQAIGGIKIAISSEPFPRYSENKLEYTKDSFRRYFIFRQIRLRPFDYVFHYDEASLSFLAEDGLQLSGAFPFPVACGTYFPVEAIKQWDIFFIGRSTNHREQFFDKLKHYHHFLHICHGVWGPPLIDYISKSKICLNVHAEDELSWEPRVQMLLALGAFVISEKITPNAFLTPGVHYVEVNSPEQMLETTRYYLNNETERLAIANAGYLRVREMLNSKVAFHDLFEAIKFGTIARFEPTRGSWKISLKERLSRRTGILW